MAKVAKFEFQAGKYFAISWGIFWGGGLTCSELYNKILLILWIIFILIFSILIFLKGAWVYYCGWKEEKISSLRNLDN